MSSASVAVLALQLGANWVAILTNGVGIGLSLLLCHRSTVHIRRNSARDEIPERDIALAFNALDEGVPLVRSL